MEQKLAMRTALKVKYSYGPNFWAGAIFLISFFAFPNSYSDLMIVVGSLLIIYDRVQCRLKRLSLFQPTSGWPLIYSEKIEFEMPVPASFKLFDRQRGIIFGILVVGFYVSFLICSGFLQYKEFYMEFAFYVIGLGLALLLYIRESKDLYRWSQFKKESKNQEFMLSNHAVYVAVRLIKFSGRISSLEKKYIVTASGHVMLHWRDIESWLVVRRSSFLLAPPTYYHEIIFLDGRKVRIDRFHFMERERELMKHVMTYSPVVIEEFYQPFRAPRKQAA